jgi:hypothetical protein
VRGVPEVGEDGDAALVDDLCSNVRVALKKEKTEAHE